MICWVWNTHIFFLLKDVNNNLIVKKDINQIGKDKIDDPINIGIKITSLNIFSIFNSKFWFSWSSPINKAPILYIENQINGKVKGFPIAVPIKEAIIFPLTRNDITIARKKWNPIKGVNETIEPQAKPAEIE